MGAVGFGRSRVAEFCAAGEFGSDVAERLAHFKDFGSVDAAGVLVWGVCSLRDVAGGEVGGDLAGIEFVLQGNLDGVLAECDVCEGAIFGVYASNSTDEEVCLLQVEVR